MATRSRRLRLRRTTSASPDDGRRTTDDGSGSAENEPPPPTPQSAISNPQSAIKKGIYLAALIYVEGEQAPADVFDAPAISALKDVLAEALEGEHGKLKLRMSLKELEVRNDVEEDDEGEEKREKFQF